MTDSRDNPQLPVPPPSGHWRADWWREIIIAAKYLTRLRVPLRGLPDRAHIRGSMAWFPLIGALIGGFGGAIDALGMILRLPSAVTSPLVVLGMLWLTRGLHEEELASLANQYGDRGDKNRRVGWLREERSVRYGTIAIMFALLLRVGTIASLDSTQLVFATLIAAGAWSHALMSVAAAWLQPLPSDPVADHFGQPPLPRVLIALCLGAAIVFAVMGDDGGLAILISAAAAALVIFIGGRMFGGYSGPLLGALQQVTELAVLCTLVAGQNLSD